MRHSGTSRNIKLKRPSKAYLTLSSLPWCQIEVDVAYLICDLISHQMPQDRRNSQDGNGFELLSQPNTATPSPHSASIPPDMIQSQATPDDVRTYLASLLRVRGLEQSHAQRIANRWTVGTGRELRSYPLAIYAKIFGPDVEDIWMVCMAVRPLCYAEDNRKNFSTTMRGILTFTSTPHPVLTRRTSAYTAELCRLCLRRHTRCREVP
jgi:hypothetical protein